MLSPKNGEKAKGESLISLIDENAHVHLHMGFI